jgi:hypothetical protein
MKISGVDPKTLPTEETLVLPRGDQFMVFRATGLKDMEEFTRLCPAPVPPQKLTKDGAVADTADQGYRDASIGHGKRRMAFIVVKSLLDIEWDTVQVDNPSTWLNWEDDLKSAGLTAVECNRVLGLVLEANSLDEAKLQQARMVFLRGTAMKPGI